LKTSVERIDGNTVKLTVTVPADEVDQAVDQAYKAMAKQVRIPGFRKGHVPRKVIDNYVGREMTLSEATETVVQTSYPKAVDSQELRTVASPDLGELDNVEPGAEYTYVAEIQVRPELTITGTEDFVITVPGGGVDEAEVDAEIEQMRERFASLEPVEDRGVQADDFVLLSFTGYVDDEPYENNTVDKYLYELGRGAMPKEFDAGLIGVEPGGETKIEFEIPDTSSVEEFVGKTARFDVTVHEIKAKVLPPVDDELAMNAGGFDSLDEMRRNILERMKWLHDLEARRAREEGVRKAVAERLEGEAPEAMIEQRKEQLGRDFEHGLESRNLSFEGYLAATGTTVEDIQAQIDAEALESVRTELALEALFRELGLEVTDDDIEAEFLAMAPGEPDKAAEQRAKWTEMGLITVVKEQVMHRKAVLWAIEHASFVDKDGNPVEDIEMVAEEPAEGSYDETDAAEIPAEAEAPSADDAAAAETEE
jgi:trigger factor